MWAGSTSLLGKPVATKLTVSWGGDTGGNMSIDQRERAVVRFPNEEEQAQGITEVPRSVRVAEYKQQQKEQSGNEG